MLGHLKNRLWRLERLYRRRRPLSQAPDIKDKRFVFIGGLHRSGTSILHRLLCQHPEISGFHNTGVSEDEGQHLQSVFKTAHEYGGPGEFALRQDAHLTEESPLINQVNRDKLLREWGAYYDLQKTVLLEKSPPNLIKSRFLRKMFPGSRFVFIVRHPVAVSLATEKWSDKSINERLLHWHHAYSIMLDDIDARDDCLVIRYEDLVARPAAMLDEIVGLIDIARFSPTETVKDYNHKYFLEWRRRYESRTSLLQATQLASNALFEYFGYSLTAPYVDLSHARQQPNRSNNNQGKS